MPFEISECIGTQLRSTIVDYFFHVSDGTRTIDIAVGITEQARHPVGRPVRTGEVLMPLAKAWIDQHINRSRSFDPFNPTPSGIPAIDARIADYWCLNGNLPPSI